MNNKYCVPIGKVLILRTCNSDLASHGGFQWPKSGHVKCPDWSPKAECGNGLHGLLWGQGDGCLLNWDGDARWLVVEVSGKSVVDLGGKVKFPSGKVVYCGDRHGATSLVYDHSPAGTVVVGLIKDCGYGSTLTGGNRSTLTGGNGSVLTGGNGSVLTGGDWSTLTGGNGSTLTGGYRSVMTGGYRSVMTGGDKSVMTGGDKSVMTGGDKSVMTFRRCDGDRIRLVTVYTGENGIEVNQPYQLSNSGSPIKASTENANEKT